MQCDVGTLCTSLQVTPKLPCFAVVSYTTCEFYGNLPQIRNDIMSNLKVEQSVPLWCGSVIT